MKKSIFFLAACAVAMTACTSSEVIEEGVQSNAIGFQNVVGKVSRADAVGTTTNPLNKFYVSGYYTKGATDNTAISVFDGEEVTLNSEGKWTYTNTRYWVPGATYYFYAYSCGNKRMQGDYGSFSSDFSQGADITSRTPGISDFVANENHQHDLVLASSEGTEGKKSDNPAVALNFQHLLSKINVVFVSDFPEGYEIAVSNVKLEGFYDIADYNTTATNKWSGHDFTTEDDKVPFLNFATFVDGNIAAAGTTEKKAKTVDAFVIPRIYEDKSVTLSFTINVKNTELVGTTNQNILTNVLLSGTWKPKWEMGKGYTYNIKISGTEAGLEPIEFTGSVSDWDGDNEYTFNISGGNVTPTPTPETPAE